MSGQEEDKKPAGDSAVHINLKVKGQDGNEVFFRIKRNTQLKKLMNAYCDRQSVDISSIAFLFDGRRLRPDFEETYEYSIDLPDLIAFKDADFSNVEAVFCCWPHGTILFQWLEIADVEEEEITDVESEEEVDDESEKVKGTQGVIQIDNPNLAKPKNMKARDVDVS
ncbi:hypothetical protein CASFOL_033471 [Castilleja foliolosa]|uniref:Ubiquitin-like domain-containing protein n=1 Tax=Castilleja foliolosa TaxID=1961234 RepID=A0ABD3BZL2_9LAMI